MYTTIGIALIVFSMVAAEHMHYPWWLLMLVPSCLGGFLVGLEKLRKEGYEPEGRGSQGSEQGATGNCVDALRRLSYPCSMYRSRGML